MMEETRDGREVERCGPDEVFGGRIARRCLLSSVLRVFLPLLNNGVLCVYCLSSAG